MIAQASIMLRLALAGSHSDRYRLLLIAAGAAIGTVFSLAAFMVLAIDGYDDRYTNNLLKEPGLRPGVATACWLLLVPTFIFIGMCTRVCAAPRERRLAALRLVGATPGQARAIGALETSMASHVGAFAGLGITLAARVILAARIEDPERVTLPVDQPFPWTAALIFCLAMPLLTGAVGALALRNTIIGPLGVVRRARHARPPAWPGVLLVSGPLAIIIANRMSAFNVGALWQPLLVLGFASTCLGLLSASAWLASGIGAATARLTGSAAFLIAGRRLEADPYGQSWAMSSVVVCTFLASAIAIFKADTLSGRSLSDAAFYARAFELVNIGLMIAVTIATAGLLVTLAEGILERRRSLAALIALGTPMSTLRRAVILQGLLPLVPAVLLATGLGCLIYMVIPAAETVSIPEEPVEAGFPFADLALIVTAGIAASLLATALSLPFLGRTVRPSELRFE